MTYIQCRNLAQAYCEARGMIYLSHEHYFHSDGRWNHLKVAAEDWSGRFEIDIDLSAKHTQDKRGAP